MARKRWNEMSPGQQTAILVVASVQISLAVTAWIDLARRPPARVRGPKPAWAAVIAVSFVGPMTYFIAGRCDPPPVLSGPSAGTAGSAVSPG